MAGLSTAEKNRRKRERKKREKEERRKEEEAAAATPANTQTTEVETIDVEIDYVAQPLPMPVKEEEQEKKKESSLPDGLPPAMTNGSNSSNAVDDMASILRKFQQRSAVTATVTDDDDNHPRDGTTKTERTEGDEDNDDDDDEDQAAVSKRKWREMSRPSIAELKRRVQRPDLVEAHDITAGDPDFLIHLKGVPGTVPVPRHWGRKRKYLQGKRGYEKPPFKLPDFIIKTGITELRDTVAEDEQGQSAKQRNRGRVNPKMGAMDVDYKTLYEAFFKFQTKPTDLTSFGDLYYEGKELETSTDRKPGGPYSKKLREALGMTTDTMPPPWLLNMQRYGPPPSYPSLAIPGLNAPLPNENCQYGYHPGGWGKPPLDAYGRPLYGGNPLDPPGSGQVKEDVRTAIVTSDGKTISKMDWGMPAGHFVGLGGDDEDEDDASEVESESEEESSDDAMEESDDEADEEEESEDKPSSDLPAVTAAVPGNLRKDTGQETPMVAGQPKQLYQVLEQTSATGDAGGVFQSNVQYNIPGATATATAPTDGAASVLSKAVVPPVDASASTKRKKKDDDDEDELDASFKF